MYEVRSEAVFLLDKKFKQGCVLSLFIQIILMELVLWNTAKAKREHGIIWEGKKNSLYLYLWRESDVSTLPGIKDLQDLF